mgnify:CR=1 FL=1
MVALLFKKRIKPLDMSLNDMANVLGLFSDELQSGVIDDNTSEFEPLEIRTINPNQSQYEKPRWGMSVPLEGMVGSGAISSVFIAYYNEKTRMRLLTPPKLPLDLTKILQLPMPKVAPLLLLPSKTTRPTYQLLSINFGFTWSITERHDRHLMFKVVGIATRKGVKDGVYLIGRDSHTNVPYLLRCPPDYARLSILDCLTWCINTNNLTDYIEI